MFFDLSKIGEYEQRFLAIEQTANQLFALLTNVSSMVQQIHAQHVAAANNGGKVDQVIGVVGEALQVAQVVGAAVSALSPDVSAPGISAAPAVNAEPAAQNAQVAQPSTHG